MESEQPIRSVRAIVENHQLEINEYFLYQAQAGAAGPVKVVRLAGPKYVDASSIPRSANTFDISVFAGKVYPNKPPGTVFLAVPAYWIIFEFEYVWACDPDAWWAQTLNFYLLTVFSVGIITALGGVIFYLALLRLFPSLPDWVHVATTLTYGLGTLVFPFATLLFDHGLLATISLGAFWLLLVEGEGGFVSFRSSLSYFLAGIVCGLTIVVNYSAILTAACLFFYGLWSVKNRLSFIGYGLVGLVSRSCFYSGIILFVSVVHSPRPTLINLACFKRTTPFYSIWWHCRGWPSRISCYRSSYRGLFFTSPVLLLALLGIVFTIYRGRQRREAIFIGSVFVVQILMNSAFNGWHAGWTFGPRYLIPSLPFLCLLLAPMFHELPRLTGGLAVLSVALMLLATAVDPQVPTAVANPLKDHIWKLSTGERLIMNDIQMASPVSANPIGAYETWGYPASSISSEQRQWHAFNLGEFLWAGSLCRLAPLALMLGIVVLFIVRSLRHTKQDISMTDGG